MMLVVPILSAAGTLVLALRSGHVARLAQVQASKAAAQANRKPRVAKAPSPQEVQAVPVALSLDERRAQVAELHAQALSNALIAERLQVHPSTITRDLAAIGSNGHS